MLITLIQTMRLHFLILTPMSIFLGFSTSTGASNIVYVDLWLVFIGALCAHISANMFNEYADFCSGLDSKTSKTHFSGGSGGLGKNPEAIKAVFFVAMICLMFAVLIGVYFTYKLDATILPIGMAGVLLIITYTKWLNRFPLLCLIAPGLGFGPLMVMGSHIIISGEHLLQVFWVSMVPFFLVNNLLLLNQFPDVNADQSVGRRHLPIVIGLKLSAYVYGFQALAAATVILCGVYLGLFPQLSVISLVPLALAVVVWIGAIKHARVVQKLIPYLALNVVVTVLTNLLLGLSFLIDYTFN